MDWSVTTNIVEAMGSGLSLLAQPPISYMVVFGFVTAGIGIARRMIKR